MEDVECDYFDAQMRRGEEKLSCNTTSHRRDELVSDQVSDYIGFVIEGPII